MQAGPRAWRYLADDGVTAAFGLAADEALTRRCGAGLAPPTVRLYTYRSHCALVGRFQRAAAEVRLDECRERGVAVNRRPTGGGAILMGADQLGVAVMTPRGELERSYDRIRELVVAEPARDELDAERPRVAPAHELPHLAERDRPPALAADRRDPLGDRGDLLVGNLLEGRPEDREHQRDV